MRARRQPPTTCRSCTSARLSRRRPARSRRDAATCGERNPMRRAVLIGAAVCSALVIAAPATAAPSARVAALQVALRAQGLYPGAIDGVAGPITRGGVTALQRRVGIV